MSILMGMLFYKGSLISIGMTYLFISLLSHFFLYEIKDKNEYYFFYNSGLSKKNLWISTGLFALINLLLLIIISSLNV